MHKIIIIIYVLKLNIIWIALFSSMHIVVL